MRWKLFLMFFISNYVWSQNDFTSNLSKVERLKNSEFPENINSLQILKKSAKTSHEVSLSDYYYSIYYTAVAQYDSAIFVLEKAKTGFKSLKEFEELANVYKQIGVIKYSFAHCISFIVFSCLRLPKCKRITLPV